jgi:hypothetical protein
VAHVTRPTAQTVAAPAPASNVVVVAPTRPHAGATLAAGAATGVQVAPAPAPEETTARLVPAAAPAESAARDSPGVSRHRNRRHHRARARR